MPLFRPKAAPVNWAALKALDPEVLVASDNDADADRLEAIYPMLVAVRVDAVFPSLA